MILIFAWVALEWVTLIMLLLAACLMLTLMMVISAVSELIISFCYRRNK